jgi:hypothetical protein
VASPLFLLFVFNRGLVLGNKINCLGKEVILLWAFTLNNRPSKVCAYAQY